MGCCKNKNLTFVILRLHVWKDMFYCLLYVIYCFVRCKNIKHFDYRLHTYGRCHCYGVIGGYYRHNLSHFLATSSFLDIGLRAPLEERTAGKNDKKGKQRREEEPVAKRHRVKITEGHDCIPIGPSRK